MVDRTQDRKLTIKHQGNQKQYNNAEANKCDGEAVHVF
jgi:hypothetical protein